METTQGTLDKLRKKESELYEVWLHMEQYHSKSEALRAKRLHNVIERKASKVQRELEHEATMKKHERICSFCGKLEGEVDCIIVGPQSLVICNHCINWAYEICKEKLMN